MKLVNAAPPPVRLTLAHDRVTALKQGHPWVFADYLTDRPKAPAGSLAILRDKTGAVVAQGMYDPSSHLAFRACAVNPERFDDALAEARIRWAFLHRRAVVDESTTAYRLLNGEGDGVPGLVCDVYGDYAVVQLDGPGPGGFWHLPGIADLIADLGGPPNVYRKNRSGEPASLAQVVRGLEPEEKTRVTEHGVVFGVDLVHGQKTGLFLDQRENRQIIRNHAKGRRVLNMFGYTGGFSVYAGRGGAAHVTTVDSAKPAIRDAVENWRMNGLEDALHDGVAADAFQFLEDARNAKKEWDLVIVDPPSFAPGKQHVDKARSAYVSILASAMSVTAPAGIFAASSCSSHIGPDLFLDLCAEAISKAKRRGTVLGIYGQPQDHPFPVACRELQYLKFVLMRID